jgi:hypothetical protein
MSVQSINEFFPSQWLKGDDIPDGEYLVLTIKSLDWEAIGFEKEFKPVMVFDETSKKLVLNKTNGKVLESLFGKNIADFIGKKISLCKKPVEFQGNTTMAIRILPEAPKSTEQINEALGEAEEPE